MLSVTAIGRAERVPGRAGAQPGDLLVVTGPLGRRGRRLPCESATSDRRSGSQKASASPRRAHAMLDISDGLAVDAGHIARRSGVRCVVDLTASRSRDGATIDDLGFGEDFELLAAVKRTRRFHRRRPGRSRATASSYV